MKRSEALKIIDTEYGKFIDEWIKLDLDSDIAISKFVRLDERLLSALEKAGMSPVIKDESDSGFNFNWDKE